MKIIPKFDRSILILFPISVREKKELPCQCIRMKLFFTGSVVKTELLVVMLEKHGITAKQEFEDASAPDDGDLSRPAKVLVPDADFDRARQLFFTEREDEL